MCIDMSMLCKCMHWIHVCVRKKAAVKEQRRSVNSKIGECVPWVSPRLTASKKDTTKANLNIQPVNVINSANSSHYAFYRGKEDTLFYTSCLLQHFATFYCARAAHPQSLKLQMCSCPMSNVFGRRPHPSWTTFFLYLFLFRTTCVHWDPVELNKLAKELVCKYLLKEKLWQL